MENETEAPRTCLIYYMYSEAIIKYNVKNQEFM